MTRTNQTKRRMKTSSRRRRSSRKKSSNWVSMLIIQVLAVIAFVGALSKAQELRSPKTEQQTHSASQQSPSLATMFDEIDSDDRNESPNYKLELGQNVRAESFNQWR